MKMVCRRCGSEFEQSGATACPECGGPALLKTSAILISARGGAGGVYSSLREIPKPLRSQLIESTTGANSGTILIADRRGRQQILRALRRVPPSRRGLLEAVLKRESVQRFRARRMLRQTLAWLAIALILMAVWLARA